MWIDIKDKSKWPAKTQGVLLGLYDTNCHELCRGDKWDVGLLRPDGSYDFDPCCSDLDMKYPTHWMHIPPVKEQE